MGLWLLPDCGGSEATTKPAFGLFLGPSGVPRFLGTSVGVSAASLSSRASLTSSGIVMSTEATYQASHAHFSEESCHLSSGIPLACISALSHAYMCASNPCVVDVR